MQPVLAIALGIGVIALIAWVVCWIGMAAKKSGKTNGTNGHYTHLLGLAGRGPHTHKVALLQGSGVSTEDYGHTHPVSGGIVGKVMGHTHPLSKLA